MIAAGAPAISGVEFCFISSVGVAGTSECSPFIATRQSLLRLDRRRDRDEEIEDGRGGCGGRGRLRGVRRAGGFRFSGMTPRSALVALIATVTGCAVVETGDHVWYREGATAAQQEAALSAAEMQAKQARVQPAEERDIVIRSMTAQGWRLMPRGSTPPPKAAVARQPPALPLSGPALP